MKKKEIIAAIKSFCKQELCNAIVAKNENKQYMNVLKSILDIAYTQDDKATDISRSSRPAAMSDDFIFESNRLIKAACEFNVMIIEPTMIMTPTQFNKLVNLTNQVRELREIIVRYNEQISEGAVYSGTDDGMKHS